MHILKNIKRNQSGDTIIEVMFATVIIAIVLAGAFSISSRSLRYNQASTERTEVANKIREQIELLNYVRDNRNELADVWNQILDYETNGGADPQEFYFVIFNDPSDPSDGLRDPITVAEYQNADPNNLVPVNDTYSADLDIFNIRILPEAKSSGDVIDFTVLANWEGIGDVGPQQSGAVLRLPR